MKDTIKEFRYKFGRASFDYEVRLKDTPLMEMIEDFWLEKLAEQEKELLDRIYEEYKIGYNQCLKDEGFTRENNQGKYL